MKKSILSRSKTLAFLDYFSGSPDAISLTLYLPPRLSPAELEIVLKEIPAPPTVSTRLSKIITPSPNGVAIFWSKKQKYVIMPPFPIQKKVIAHSYDAAPLHSQISPDRVIGLVLVRLGSYAVGICQGDKLITSKVGTGLVHGRHRQGGSSAHRFERHRDKQIESFLIRVCGHVREQFEPHVKSMDYIVYGGARTTIQVAQKYCPFLEKLDKPVLPPLLDIPEPRLPVLKDAVTRVWSSTFYDFSDD